MIEYIIASFTGYFLGSFQTAFFMGKLVSSIDIRQHGSNNAGASNVAIVVGWKYGVITALTDILKGVVAVWFIRFLYPDSTFLPFLAGSMAVIGHIFPYYLGFSGGKGLATMIGMALAYDYRIGLIMFITVALITIITNYIAIAAIVMYTLFPVLIYIFGYTSDNIIVAIVLAFIAYYKHHINVIRIINKEEKGLRASLKKR